jgi:hypothetical protein
MTCEQRKLPFGIDASVNPACLSLICLISTEIFDATVTVPIFTIG